MEREIKCLKKGDNAFPKSLESLLDCPEVIYVLGDEKILNDFSLAMIGSRVCSECGKILATNIARELNEKNIIIVSGLARGIDSAAHIGCIKNKGKTIAVLGGGFNNIYPRENNKLVDEIIENGGAVITEYSPEMPVFKKNFIERNRIISAISDGVILIEAKEKSGSLTTIKYAKKLNKKIYVVPGGINDELYEGSNRILSEGACCVRNAQDVWANLDETIRKKLLNKVHKSNNVKKVKEENISLELRSVYKQIKNKPISLEQICIELNESAASVLTKLTLLEMNGYVIELKGKRFIKVK